METQTTKKKIFNRPVQSIIIMIVIFWSLGGVLYWYSIKDIVEMDNSYVDVPVATLAATSPGVLNAVYVKEGDTVSLSTAIAEIGSETLYAKEAGTILSYPQTLGAYYQPGQSVATVLANSKMRLVSTIAEDKGLSRLKVGQAVSFTVDAFSGKKYIGVITEISPSSKDAGLAFSISDKRPTKEFDVHIAFDSKQYPELKNGMSAKAYVYIQ
jgi:multidrug resistance efflux pump